MNLNMVTGYDWIHGLFSPDAGGAGGGDSGGGAGGDGAGGGDNGGGDGGGPGGGGGAASGGSGPGAGGAKEAGDGGAPDAGGGGDAGDGGGGNGGEKDGAGDDPYAFVGPDLSDDEKNYLDAKGYKDARSILKGVMNAEKALRASGKIPAPPEDASKIGEWMKEQGIAEKLGVPKEVSGYDLTPPEMSDAMKAMVPWDGESDKKFASLALDLGVSKDQFGALRKAYVEATTAAIEGEVASAVADEQKMQNDLRAAWGDQYDSRVQAAVEEAEARGITPEAVDTLRRGNVIGSAAIMRLLAEANVARGDHELLGGGQPGGGRITPEDAARQAKEYGKQHSAALTDEKHPEHAMRVREWNNLRSIASGGKT